MLWIKLETVEVLMCPMDSIAEFIFVFNDKASSKWASEFPSLAYSSILLQELTGWVGWQWGMALEAPA